MAKVSYGVTCDYVETLSVLTGAELRELHRLKPAWADRVLQMVSEGETAQQESP